MPLQQQSFVDDFFFHHMEFNWMNSILFMQNLKFLSSEKGGGGCYQKLLSEDYEVKINT